MTTPAPPSYTEMDTAIDNAVASDWSTERKAALGRDLYSFLRTDESEASKRLRDRIFRELLGIGATP